MSLFKEIYVFYYNYSKILNSSSGPNVTAWTISDVNNAIKWANNCEDLSAKLKKKPYFGHFLQELEKIFSYSKLSTEKCTIEELILNATTHIKKVLSSVISLFIV